MSYRDPGMIQLDRKIHVLRVKLKRAEEGLAHHKAYHMSVVKWLAREEPEVLRKLLVAVTVGKSA